MRRRLNVAMRSTLVTTCSLILVTSWLGTAVADPAGPDATSPGDSGVLTYHGDNLRTGWDRRETSLNTTNVQAGSFGLLASVPLDDQVDAQPLVAPNQTISGGASPGMHDVVYVASESDSVYAIDAHSGAVLLKRTLGSPIPQAQLPGGCVNNGPNVGIGSTPVIDRGTNTLYLIADTFESGHAVFRIHALDLRTLLDKIAPVVVAATRPLSNGTTYTFSADVERQRAALLESGSNVYAAFASYCDQSANVSRGLILGWQAGTLAPLATKDLTDSDATSSQTYFLSAIWMSGAGLASDESGSIFLSTGNSDASSYDEGAHDIQESIIRVSPDLATLQSYFTPSNYANLDNTDDDIGSGGVLLVPYQNAGTIHRIALAAGKDGRLFILNREALGGYAASTNHVLDTVSMGGCFCAESFFVGSDGVPRIVTSGNSQITSWRLQTTPSVALFQESTSPAFPNGQDPGMFTTISSNATTAGTAIAWTVTHPNDSNPADVELAAVDPSDGAVLYSADAGTWPSSHANANIVPSVAGGRVFVASYKQLAIFGLLPPGTRSGIPFRPSYPRYANLPAGTHQFTGVIGVLTGSAFILRTRTGRLLQVDATAAVRTARSVKLYLGETVFVRGRLTGPWGLDAASILREKWSAAMWAADR